MTIGRVVLFAIPHMVDPVTYQHAETRNGQANRKSQRDRCRDDTGDGDGDTQFGRSRPRGPMLAHLIQCAPTARFTTH